MKSKRKGKFKHYGSQISKETLRRSGKYIPPEKSNPLKEIPTLYKPYYLLEKRVLEPVGNHSLPLVKNEPTAPWWCMLKTWLN